MGLKELRERERAPDVFDDTALELCSCRALLMKISDCEAGTSVKIGKPL